jgi:hypothetical protein
MLDQEKLLPFGVRPESLDVETFDRLLPELIAPGDAPGHDAVVLTRLVWRRWRDTGDYRWPARLGAVEHRLRWLIGKECRGRRNAEQYFAWRESWLKENAPVHSVELLSGSARQATRKAMARAEERGWKAKAQRYRDMLIRDGLARWYAGKDSTDGRRLRAARRGRQDAIALGWKP